jgi:hypothetical protein
MNAKAKPLLVQAQITGYTGPAVNLLAAVHAAKGLVVVSKELPLGERVPGATFTTNDTRADSRDRLFVEDHFQDAIRLFYRAYAMRLLELMPPVAKHDPTHRIEVDGMNEHGTKYRLANEISNGAVAVLAIFDAAEISLNVAGAADMVSELSAMFMTI